MASRTRMSAEARRAQLVEVAAVCFADHGFGRTTTAMIAAAAGISEPVLYRHFASKLDLFHSALTATLEEARAHFKAVAKTGESGAARLLKIAEDFPRYTHERRAFLRTIDRALAGARDEGTRGLLRSYYRDFVVYLEGVVRSGIADGSIRASTEPVAVAWTLIMTSVGFGLVADLQMAPVIGSGFTRELRQVVASMICPIAAESP